METFTIESLASETRNYFALKAVDDESNWSAMSNVDSVTTSSPPPDPFALRISPENLLLNLKAAYGLGDVSEFTDLLDPNFDFIFSEGDQGQLAAGEVYLINWNNLNPMVGRNSSAGDRPGLKCLYEMLDHEYKDINISLYIQCFLGERGGVVERPFALYL